MNTLRSQYFIFIALFVLAIVTNSCNSETSQKKPDNNQNPNVIIILADDAGYADFGFMGSDDMLTPNLDKLASDGTIFTDAHVTASVCSPSRAGLLTGRYQQRFGHECNLEPNQQTAFDSAQITIAEFLKSKNYRTSIFGKWHLGEAEHQHPLQNGFDYFWGFLAGGRSYFANEAQDKPGNPNGLQENGKPQKLEGYLTDQIGNKAAQYIEKNANDSAPFFMYLSFNAPHTPMHAKKEVIEMFGEGHQRPVYAAMVWSMDEAIGQVITTLKDQGIYNNTVIFFLSDNGGAHNNNSNVAPLKGWKGNQFEGGTRVPFTVTWNGTLPGGNRFDGLSSSLDIYQTIASFWPDQKTVLDGIDLIPFIAGEKAGNPHDQLFWRKDQMATIRSKEFKYITLFDSVSVMYDLKNDLSEANDVKNMNLELVDKLETELDLWQNQLKAPFWKEPESWNRVTRRVYFDLMANRPANVKEPADLRQLSNLKTH
ncbi:MAG: sulfatase-like hydrolase/transferase [Cyclobacteriaceae bacterium]